MNELLRLFDPITLQEMSSVKLMNRTDTKFVTTDDRLRLLLEMAKRDYRVQEIDGARTANYYTLYFDTPSKDMFMEHQHGHAGRQKVRFRSYVDSRLHFLEVKTKDNHGRTRKKRIGTDDLCQLRQPASIRFERQDDTFMACDEFLRKRLKFAPETLSGHVENRFSRITLVNKALTERLTIDRRLSFHNLETGQNRSMDHLVIVELKRDGQVGSPVLAMLNQLRIMPMGFSKYCMGAALTNPGLPVNRFKPRLRRVEKMLSNP